MENALVLLTIATIAFVGTHFLMSHPLRAPMVAALGDMGFQVVYSVVILATMAAMYFTFIEAPVADLPGTGQTGWIIATLISVPAMVLFAGSVAGNPAMAVPGGSRIGMMIVVPALTVGQQCKQPVVGAVFSSLVVAVAPAMRD